MSALEFLPGLPYRTLSADSNPKVVPFFRTRSCPHLESYMSLDDCRFGSDALKNFFSLNPEDESWHALAVRAHLFTHIVYEPEFAIALGNRIFLLNDILFDVLRQINSTEFMRGYMNEYIERLDKVDDEAFNSDEFDTAIAQEKACELVNNARSANQRSNVTYGSFLGNELSIYQADLFEAAYSLVFGKEPGQWLVDICGGKGIFLPLSGFLNRPRFNQLGTLSHECAHRLFYQICAFHPKLSRAIEKAYTELLDYGQGVTRVINGNVVSSTEELLEYYKPTYEEFSAEEFFVQMQDYRLDEEKENLELDPSAARPSMARLFYFEVLEHAKVNNSELYANQMEFKKNILDNIQCVSRRYAKVALDELDSILRLKDPITPRRTLPNLEYFASAPKDAVRFRAA